MKIKDLKLSKEFNVISYTDEKGEEFVLSPKKDVSFFAEFDYIDRKLKSITIKDKEKNTKTLKIAEIIVSSKKDTKLLKQYLTFFSGNISDINASLFVASWIKAFS